MQKVVTTGAAILFVGGVVMAPVAMFKMAYDAHNANKEDARIELLKEDFSAQIERDLIEKGNVDLTDSTVSVSTLSLDNDEAKAAARGGDLLSVYGKIQRQNYADAFKMVYNTHHHMVFDANKVMEQFGDAEFVELKVIENKYIDIFDRDFSAKNLADTVMPGDSHKRGNQYRPVFAEIGSYERDGKNYGYVKYAAEYITQEQIVTNQGDGGFFENYATGSAIGNALSATGINPGLGPMGMMGVSGGRTQEVEIVRNVTFHENTLTAEIDNDLSKENIFSTVMDKVKAKDASVVVDSSYTDFVEAKRAHEPKVNTEQLEDFTMGR